MQYLNNSETRVQNKISRGIGGKSKLLNDEEGVEVGEEEHDDEEEEEQDYDYNKGHQRNHKGERLRKRLLFKLR